MVNQIDEVIILRQKLNLLASENEKLIKENKKLKKELEENQKLFSITSEYSTLIENELVKIIETNNPGQNIPEENINNFELLNLKTKFSVERAEKEKLIVENKKIKEEIEKMDLIFTNTLSHGTTIENELDDKLKIATELSNIDPLTKIYNRNKFYEVLSQSIDCQNNKTQNISLIMFDIDFFKKINDTYGHDAGDSALVELSILVLELIRDKDVFSRWGGEEFMILVINSELPNTIKLCKRIRAKINNHHFKIVNHINCSFGIAQYKPGEEIETFLKRVDISLYRAKNNGRNRIEIDL